MKVILCHIHISYIGQSDNGQVVYIIVSVSVLLVLTVVILIVVIFLSYHLGLKPRKKRRVCYGLYTPQLYTYFPFGLG